jgi:phage baseplate assembly protein W
MLQGPAFPFRLAGGHVVRSAGPQKVAEDLLQLLGTRLGERLMLRGYGCGVHHRLQEPNDHTLRTLVRHELEQALRTYLPTARLTGPIRLLFREGELVVALDYAVDPADVVRRLEVTLAGAP